MTDYDIVIEPDGTVVTLYSDDLAAAMAGERLEVRRASHVEPHPTRPGWLADLRPVGGPVLGRGWHRTPEAIAWSLAHDGCDGVASLPPFETRQAALAAEVAWLNARLAQGPLDVIGG